MGEIGLGLHHPVRESLALQRTEGPADFLAPAGGLTYLHEFASIVIRFRPGLSRWSGNWQLPLIHAYLHPPTFPTSRRRRFVGKVGGWNVCDV